jgi:hypothetical protein
VVTLGIDGKDTAREFLEKLKKNDKRNWRLLVSRIGNVSNFSTYENDQIFNFVGQGIYEFKRPGLRLYAFYDEFGTEHQLILCTNGGTKNTRKEQLRDINRAKSIRAEYLAAKTRPEARFTIKETP